MLIYLHLRESPLLSHKKKKLLICLNVVFFFFLFFYTFVLVCLIAKSVFCHLRLKLCLQWDSYTQLEQWSKCHFRFWSCGWILCFALLQEKVHCSSALQKRCLLPLLLNTVILHLLLWALLFFFFLSSVRFSKLCCKML